MSTILKLKQIKCKGVIKVKEQNSEKFLLSYSLENHPLKEESHEYKTQYLSIIEYFISKYSDRNELSKSMFERYKTEFNIENTIPLSNEKIIQQLRRVFRNKFKFKSFKVLRYRYCLLCDLFMLIAFNDTKKALRMLEEIKLAVNKRYHSEIEQLFNLLYYTSEKNKKFSLADCQINSWIENKLFLSKPKRNILVAANMSAGKSTLINSLVGKKINRTMNDACTSKIHYIYEKAFDENKTHEWDYEINLNADHNALMCNDERNKGNKILIATTFNMIGDRDIRLCLIDTPGVNSSTNKEHGEISKETISREDFDLLLYVINAENAGTDDDSRFISYISEVVPNEKIVFVLNKLDRFRIGDDSICESVENLANDLKSIGFENPIICPVSAFTGLLTKKKLKGEQLTEDENDELDMLKRKFNKSEFDLSQYYINQISEIKIDTSDENIQLLINSGIYDLEQLILKK